MAVFTNIHDNGNDVTDYDKKGLPFNAPALISRTQSVDAVSTGPYLLYLVPTNREFRFCAAYARVTNIVGSPNPVFATGQIVQSATIDPLSNLVPLISPITFASGVGVVVPFTPIQTGAFYPCNPATSILIQFPTPCAAVMGDAYIYTVDLFGYLL